MASGQSSGAAQRRRQRRQCWWWRHEQQSIAAALAAATHHSAQQNGALRSQRTATRAREEAGSETYYAPRGLKTLPPGTRPAPLSEVAGPQGAAATVGYVAAGAPLLVVASLAGGDDVDATTVSYLISVALAKKKVEEENEKEEEEKAAEEVKAREERKAKLEEKMLVINRRVRDGTATPAEEAAWRRWMGIAPGFSSSSSGKRRKRKKKRKRKLPKSSSRSSSGHGRPCDHQRRVPAVQEVRVHGASDSVHRRRLDILVVQRQVRGFLVQKTVVVPQLQFIVGRRHSFRAAEADPHGPVCSADHGDSAVAAYFGGRCPCCASRAGSQVLPWRRPWRSHSCSSLRNHTLSTTLRIWQSLVRRSPLEYRIMVSSGR